MQKGADINGDIITDPNADKPPKPAEGQVCLKAWTFVKEYVNFSYKM